MSKKPRRRDGPTMELPQPSLPEDLELEIIARTDDAATVVRSAAASKPLRRAILDPAFRRRSAVANKGARFDPALLADVSHRICEYGNATIFNTPNRVQFERRLLNSFEPACSRDGFVVLWRNRQHERSFNEYNVELRVCNVFTGYHASLPRTKLISKISIGICGGIYHPALLPVEEGAEGHSFKVLVMDRGLQIVTFYSQGGNWGPSRRVRVHSSPILSPLVSNEKVCRAPAVVIGSTVHWLCHLIRNLHDLAMIILAVDADTAQARTIKLPEDCLTRLGSWDTSQPGDPAEGRLMLAATAATDEATTRRLLSLFVAEPTMISMWTLITPDEESNGWSCQTVIRRREIVKQLGSGMDTYQAIRFMGFGERSGTVIFFIKRVGLVQLNLVTKKVVLLRGCIVRSGDVRACLHEVNLACLLSGMKPF